VNEAAAVPRTGKRPCGAAVGPGRCGLGGRTRLSATRLARPQAVAVLRARLVRPDEFGLRLQVPGFRWPRALESLAFKLSQESLNLCVYER
jgi:hypothetical protein